MKFSCPTDFLRTAQWLKPLEMPPKRDVILDSFDRKIVGFGSCFAQNLKASLDEFYFPFWFNRDSCAHYTTFTLLQTLRRAAGFEEHREDEFFFVNGNEEDVILLNYFKLRYFGPDALAKAKSKREFLDRELLEKIREADVFILTLGNSTIFLPTGTQTVPCNVYGLWRHGFTPKQQTVDDVEQDLREIHSILRRVRDGRPFKLILTVSPQRYLYQPSDLARSSLENNWLMKSTLRVAADSFVRAHAAQGAYYFPAFEMVIDELRLYETLSTYDHLHINQDFTPRYVVKKFLRNHASDEVLAILPLIEGWKELVDQTKVDFARGATPTHPEILAAWTSVLGQLTASNAETVHATWWRRVLETAKELKMLELLQPESADQDVAVALAK